MISAFGDILTEVVKALPNASGAVFVDWEGESVDHVTGRTGHDLPLLGAQWTIAYQQTRAVFEKLGRGAPDELVLRFQRQQIVLRRVTDEYAVLLALGAEGDVARASHLLALASERLRGEM